MICACYVGSRPCCRSLNPGTHRESKHLRRTKLRNTLPPLASNELLAAEFDPTPNFRYFIASGSSHVLLTRTPPITVGGVTLSQFLTQMVADDPAWANVHP